MLAIAIIGQSWLIGIALAAPVGPIGMLCIRKTLELGFIGALGVGLGAACADIVYGTLASAGLGALTNFLLEQSMYIKLFGGLFLLYLGFKEFSNTESSARVAVANTSAFLTLCATTFFLTLTNPMTIMSFIGVFSSLGGKSFTFYEAVLMVLGIFLGSLSWWCILGGIVTYTRGYLSSYWINQIRLLSAVILTGFGVWAMIGAITLLHQSALR